MPRFTEPPFTIDDRAAGPEARARFCVEDDALIAVLRAKWWIGPKAFAKVDRRRRERRVAAKTDELTNPIPHPVHPPIFALLRR